VYEDETTIAFLDANPLAPGHTLVIPKDEYERLNDVPEDIATDLYATIHRMVPAVEEAVDADATTVAFNNGEESGQEVPHVHCHIVPGSRATAAAPFTPCSVAGRSRGRRTRRHRRRDRVSSLRRSAVPMSRSNRRTVRGLLRN